jgi:hypothetical protein
MKQRLLIGCALGYFVGWIVVVVVAVMRVQSGGANGLLSKGGLLSTTIQVCQSLIVAACWFGSIYLWLQKGGTGGGRVVSVLCLAFFGMFIGPFYILLNARYLAASPNEITPSG